MKTILFLDDDPDRHAFLPNKFPKDRIIHVYTLNEFRKALEYFDAFDVISLDYDLNDFKHESLEGSGLATGLDACGYMIAYRAKLPQEVLIHSWNEDGSKEMAAFLESRGIAYRLEEFPI